MPIKLLTDEQIKESGSKTSEPTSSIGEYIKSIPLKDSAIPVWKRWDWGNADDWGKLKILKESDFSGKFGSNVGDAVRLDNGEFGVRTEYGIKPVDPKGFQVARIWNVPVPYNPDIAGDILESGGKAISTAGGIAGAVIGGAMGTPAGPIGISTGGIIGASIGAGVGQGIGESIRQTIGYLNKYREPIKPSELITKKGEKGQIQLGPVGEIGMETLGAGVSQFIGSTLIAKLGRLGSTKPAASALDDFSDDIVKNLTPGQKSIMKIAGLGSKEIKPDVLDAYARFVGLDKTGNKELLADLLNKKIKYIPAEDAIDSSLNRVVEKINTLANNGRKILGEQFKNDVTSRGIDLDSLYVPIKNELNALDDAVNILKNKPKASNYASIINTLIEQKAWAEKNLTNNSLIKYRDLQELTEALYETIPETIIDGEKTKATGVVKNAIGKFLQAKNIPGVDVANKNYHAGLKAISDIKTLLRIRMMDGETTTTMRSPARLVIALGNKLNNQALNKFKVAADVLDNLPVLKDMKLGEDALSTMLASKLISAGKTPMTGFAGTIPGAKNLVKNALFHPISRAGTLAKLVDLGFLDAEKMTTETTKKFIPTINAFMRSATDRTYGQLTQSLLGTQRTSLNDLLYKNNNLNKNQ